MTPTDIEQLPYRKNAGVVLRNRNGLIFAGQRIDNNQDAWQMPQGGIDDGEDPLDAAYRELEEETGVSKKLVTLANETQDWLTYDLPIDLVPKLWKGRYRGQAQKWYLMDFLGVNSDVNIALPKPEFSKWVWMPSDKLVEKIVPFKREIYTAVFEEFDLI